MIFANKKFWCFPLLLLVVNLSAAEKAAEVNKPSLAEEILKLVISGKGRDLPNKFKWVTVPFEKMPAVCQKDCANEIELYGKDSNFALVAYIDIDGDGTLEMLVTYRSYHGNGGRGYDLLTKRNGKWVKCGYLFGVYLSQTEFNGRRGLLEESKCGCSERTHSFYELKNGKLVNSVKIKIVRSLNQSNPQLKIEVKASDESNFDYLF